MRTCHINFKTPAFSMSSQFYFFFIFLNVLDFLPKLITKVFSPCLSTFISLKPQFAISQATNTSFKGSRRWSTSLLKKNQEKKIAKLKKNHALPLLILQAQIRSSSSGPASFSQATGVCIQEARQLRCRLLSPIELT